MEKKILYGISSLLFIGLILSFVLLNEWRGSPKETEQTLAQSSGKETPLITIKENDESNPAENTIVKISEPTIRLFGNKIAAERANAYVLRFIADERDRYLLAEAKDKQSGTEQQNIVSTFSLIANVSLNTPKLVTIRFIESSLLKHKQKADTSVHFIMFDLEQGTPVSFAGLFKDEGALTKIAKLFSDSSGPGKPLSEESVKAALNQKHALGVSSKGLTLSVEKGGQEQDGVVSEEITIPLPQIREMLHNDIADAITKEGENIRMSEPILEDTP